MAHMVPTKAFYSQPQQLPCAWHPVPNPTNLPFPLAQSNIPLLVAVSLWSKLSKIELVRTSIDAKNLDLRLFFRVDTEQSVEHEPLQVCNTRICSYYVYPNVQLYTV